MDPRRRRRLLYTALGAVAAATLVSAGVVGWRSRRPLVVVVNATAADGISVFVDGSPVASNLARAARETPEAAVRTRVGAGVHRFEARDRTGAVVDAFEAELRRGGAGYLYAPAHAAETCFFVQRDEYRADPSAPSSIDVPIERLEPARSFWRIDEPIDYWFQDSPSDITVAKDKAGRDGAVVLRAVRQGACDDPAFAP